MTNAVAELESYDATGLCAALSRGYPGEGSGEVSVGILARGSITTALIDGARRARPGDISDGRGPVGCVAKVLTGALALQAAAAGQLDFDRCVTEADEPLLHPSMRGTSVRQLLSHTHGLDLSHIENIPRTPSGYIDVRALGAALREARRLFEPGALYSYNNVGCWLTVALLERACRGRFAELLTAKVLRPAGIGMEWDDVDGSAWCPATGGDLQLSVPELLLFCRWFFLQDAAHGAQLQVPLAPPGWCLERGSCAGWKYYGSGWYGHHTAVGEHSLAVRAQFQQQLAIVIATRNGSADAAAMTLIRMFGRLLPEFLQMDIPRALSSPVLPAEFARCVGTYADHATVARVSFNAGSGLQLELFTGTQIHRDDAPELRSSLKRATGGAYLAGSVPLQFIVPTDEGYQYVWNGRQVLRRI